MKHICVFLWLFFRLKWYIWLDAWFAIIICWFWKSFKLPRIEVWSYSKFFSIFKFKILNLEALCVLIKILLMVIKIWAQWDF
jgi:hypothetical protein